MIHTAIHEALWNDYDPESEFPAQTPLLAHYTSISNFDCIVEGEELWFSNPLNMNDLEELLFGMNQGANEFRHNDSLYKACGNEEVYGRLLAYFDHYYNDFDKYNALDTYVLCFSEHDVKNYDGELSMWRGYGSDGEGVAFVIDTQKITPNEASPIILSKVHYVTTEERLEWIKQKIESLAAILSPLEKSDDTLNSVAWNWIERLKVFSLFTKHRGFSDEKEWRFVYLSDRDAEKRFEPMYGYNISSKGVEPKLKLKLCQIPDDNSQLTIEKIVDRIILGPSVSSELSKRSVARLLQIKGKGTLVEKVYASSIPYRP